MADCNHSREVSVFLTLTDKIGMVYELGNACMTLLKMCSKKWVKVFCIFSNITI